MENENLELEPLIEIDEETIETPEDYTEEVVEIPEVDIAQVQATNKKLYERAKKAEAELKALRGNPVAKSAPTSSVNVEEVVLQAQGMSDELISELKAVAKVRGISLIKAQNDPIFVAVKENFEKEQKQKNASLPASRGAGAVKAQKKPNTPGLTREEHKALLMSEM
jgi:hypothetical protein